MLVERDEACELGVQHGIGVAVVVQIAHRITLERGPRAAGHVDHKHVVGLEIFRLRTTPQCQSGHVACQSHAAA